MPNFNHVWLPVIEGRLNAQLESKVSVCKYYSIGDMFFIKLHITQLDIAHGFLSKKVRIFHKITIEEKIIAALLGLGPYDSKIYFIANEIRRRYGNNSFFGGGICTK